MDTPKHPKKKFGPIVKIPMEVLQAQKRGVKRVPRKKNATTGYTLDPGQKAALEKKFEAASWHRAFTSFSFFDSFKGPKK